MAQYHTEARLRSLKTWDVDAVKDLCSISRLRLWTFEPHSTFEPGVLRQLAQLRQLQFLTFQESELESENLRALARIPLLRRLNLKGCRFAKDDFIWLCEQWASGACPKLSDVWLEETQLGDEELQALGKVERLRWVILSGTPISDAGLKHLAGVKKLETLWLQNTQVSEAGVLGLALLPKLSIVVLSDAKESERVRERLFRAQLALQKSKKPLDKAQLDAADARLRAFLTDMEDWERAAYQRAQDIEKRHRAERPLPNQLGDAEARENTEFWRDLNAQKTTIAKRYCSRKLLERGAERAASYGKPPRFSCQQEWVDFETPSSKKTIFYGDGRWGSDGKRRYTLVWEEGEWKLDEVQWWSGGWKRDIV